ncbi:hypothetical protein LTR91_026496 [Friedmanniomyces endolithicus]|uniref:Uncharacterized protein n=1 Tax=Friedmanniomyces endolithicus TaxID=329885 RepID=A0AAN6K204_9PEZI|nr:hypothetical protein LTR57_025536 [Friedmanniomyces endolithicus]KAK0949395.1 hypothetical protein LTR91_026496 [Friedmanniomyces endolithicus]KAK0950158.1 hypothetical protein LTS01_025659 [Friedmanniomyces endolithicus]KAK1021371.1 hypothetical protein LTS16_026555 [Friedmanniomyces endolithicus]
MIRQVTKGGRRQAEKQLPAYIVSAMAFLGVNVQTEDDIGTFLPPLRPPSPRATGPRLTDETVTCLEDAAKGGYVSTAREILEAAASDDPNHSYPPSVGAAGRLAATYSQLEVMELLLSCRAKVGSYNAHRATLSRDIPMLELLLQHGWDINEPMETRPPPLGGLQVAYFDLGFRELERLSQVNTEEEDRPEPEKDSSSSDEDEDGRQNEAGSAKACKATWRLIR